MSRNIETCWNQIFQELNIIKIISNNGFIDVSANDIKRIANMEPRLMTKVDFVHALPSIMRDNNLSILAIENWLYRVANSNPYIKIKEKEVQEIHINTPTWYLTLDPFDITSESWALDIANVSWILSQVFKEDTELTIRWRLRKWSNFDFKLNWINYPVRWVQIEIDWWYEWKTSVNIVEAKMGGVSTINIRQLLYPELAWKGLLNWKKQVKTFIFLYEEPFFRFIPFIYDGDNSFADLKNELVFKFIWWTSYDLKKIKKLDKPEINLNVPFPQADDFEKVLIMLRKISSFWWEMTKEQLETEMEEYELVHRQIDYYSNCLKLMKLCDYEKQIFKLTKKWSEISKLKSKEQAWSLAEIIFSEETFHLALHAWVDSIPDWLFNSKWWMSGSTIWRRKSTLRSWIKWFKDMFEN